MIFMSPPQIYIDENEFDFESRRTDNIKNFKLNSETSVLKVKAHFFEALSEVGEIRKFSQADAIAGGNLAHALNSQNALVASFHEPPPELPCRLLQHTKGGLMLPGGFLSGWTFRESTMNLVETTRQKRQLETSLGGLSIELGVFAQRLATDIFQPLAAERRKRAGSNTSDFTRGRRLVYAGRMIPNKGIAQLIRCLNLWPIKKTTLALIGDYEPSFPISQAGGDCALFESWFQREVVARNRDVFLKIFPSMPQSLLVHKFWNSDAFLYPSFHEDEASGNAAHEAVLSGIPAIVTDWCGLGQLGRNTQGGAIATYPTLGGVRYSLLSLRRQIATVTADSRRWDGESAFADSQWVKTIFDPSWMRDSVRKSIGILLGRSVDPAPESGWRCPTHLKKLASFYPGPFQDALSHHSDADPDGLYVDGSGYRNDSYSEARFLTAIQGFYTTWPTSPQLQIGIRLHGFWRVGVWDDERALVEFGFPGPRLLRFSKEEWQSVRSSARPIGFGEIDFVILDEVTASILQRAVDLGYLVPHEPESCNLLN